MDGFSKKSNKGRPCIGDPCDFDTVILFYFNKYLLPFWMITPR